MATSYDISRRTWKWTKKLFFHLLNITGLNSCVALATSGGMMDQRQYRLALLRQLIEKGKSTLPSITTGRGRTSVRGTELYHLEAED
jgi:hypothetical protein